MPRSVTETLAPRLREEMDRRNIAPLALAQQAGVGRSFIYDLLNGKSENPTSGKLHKVARALDVTMPYLLSGQACDTDIMHKEGYVGIRWLEGDNLKESYLPLACMQHLNPDHTLLRLMQVRSDEMESTLFDKDTIIIDTDIVAGFSAGIYAICEGNAIVLRRLNIMHKDSHVCYVVRADNTNYESYTVDCGCLNILGKAVWRMGAI